MTEYRGYQRLIHEIDPTVDPAAVEAQMRLQYGTLDHLPRSTFVSETRIAKQCEAAQPGYFAMIKRSYAL